MAHIILFGNEKGGSGKTTTAMHLVIALMYLEFRVAAIDIDIRQASLSRYIENRRKTSANLNLQLLIPTYFKMIKEYDINKSIEYTQNDLENFEALIKKLYNDHDFIIIDTPGNDNILNRHAHYMADTIITPINDSFLDLDLLGQVDSKDYSKFTPGIYSSMVWEQKKYKAFKKNKEINWIVVRNRLSSIDIVNKRNVGNIINFLGKRLGFSVASGFGNRVIFKELFLAGLTLLDAKKASGKIKMNPSVISARQELRDFLFSLKLVQITERL